MKNIKVSFDNIKQVGSYYIFKCTGITENIGFGDLMTFDKKDKILEVSDFIDVDDSEVREFLSENTRDYKAVLGFMRQNA